jgi:hypothetical protein
MCFLKSLIHVSLITWLQKNSGKIGPGKQKFQTHFLMQCRIPLLYCKHMLQMLTHSTVYGSLNTGKTSHNNTLSQHSIKKVENNESFERCGSDCSTSAALIKSTCNLQFLFTNIYIWVASVIQNTAGYWYNICSNMRTYKITTQNLQQCSHSSQYTIILIMHQSFYSNIYIFAINGKRFHTSYFIL